MQIRLLFIFIICFFLFSCSKEDVDLTSSTINEGLVAHYPLNGHPDDFSGNSNHGKISGAVPSSGRSGNDNTAFLFNGSSNVISLPKPFFEGKRVSQFTLSITFRLNVLSKTASALWAKNGFWQGATVNVTPDGKLQFVSSIPTFQYQNCISDMNIVEPNKWYNLVVSYDNAICSLYLNGTKIATKNSTLNQGGGKISDTMAGFVDFAQTPGGNSNGTNLIGCANSVNTGNTDFTNGVIDDFRLYNRILTNSEILFLSKNN